MASPVFVSARAPPTSFLPAVDAVIPRVSEAIWVRSRAPDGSASSTSYFSTCCVRTFCASTTGLAPVTVIVSSTAPTRISALTVGVKPADSSIPSRRTVEKPVSVNVTV